MNRNNGKKAGKTSWRPEQDTDAWDPRKASILIDPDDHSSLGRLGEEQIQIVLTVRQYVVTYADSREDAWERMPNMMRFLHEAFPISASLFGTGREQLVDVLAHDEHETPSPEYVVERREAIDADASASGGEQRGF